MKFLYGICDISVNLNKNDSYYILSPTERKVFKKMGCMRIFGSSQRHRRIGCVKTGETNFDEHESGSWAERSVRFFRCRATRGEAE